MMKSSNKEVGKINKRKHYALFSCDSWKSFDSMSFIGVFTFNALKKVIKRKIKNDDFEIGLVNVNEIDNMEVQEINSRLMYGYIEEITINEEL